MRGVLVLLSILLINAFAFSQVVTNGNFSATSSYWYCNPEANHWETTYGGSTPGNRVAEVDASAGLCQTISGFVIGNYYTIILDVSRRTNCGPTLQTMDLTVDGGALLTSISRNGTPFIFVTEFIGFTATQNSHTITFNGTSAGTCGLILDNISVISGSPLPVTLLSFEGSEIDDRSSLISWSTSSEFNNSHFVIEKSSNNIDWFGVGTVEGIGDSEDSQNYNFVDIEFSRDSYYRLIQVDLNGVEEVFGPIFIAKYSGKINVFPNPATNRIEITSVNSTSCRFFSSSGIDLTNQVSFVSSSQSSAVVDVSNLNTGLYFVQLGNSVKELIVK